MPNLEKTEQKALVAAFVLIFLVFLLGLLLTPETPAPFVQQDPSASLLPSADAAAAGR